LRGHAYRTWVSWAILFVRIDGLLYATPMFLVLLMIEASDLVFAVDSIRPSSQ
jgi:predicted tellurium resistance membrane protein TerC